MKNARVGALIVRRLRPSFFYGSYGNYINFYFNNPITDKYREGYLCLKLEPQ